MTNPLNDPFMGFAAGAVQLHEMFVSLIDAGFTEDQAMHLIGVMLMNAAAARQEAEEDG